MLLLLAGLEKTWTFLLLFYFFFFLSPWRSDGSYPQTKSFNLQVKLIFTLHMLTGEWQKCLTFLKSVSGKEKDKHNIRFSTDFSVSKLCFQWNVNLTKMLYILLYLGKDVSSYRKHLIICFLKEISSKIQEGTLAGHLILCISAILQQGEKNP